MGFETRRRTAEQRGGPIGVWAPEGIEGPGCGARGWRKNGNWTHAQPHFRYKTHPADPFSPHARYKTRPAGPKRPFLARFSHAWRTLYRFRQEKAEHGELCAACEAETGLAITAHQAPQVWRAPGGLEGQAAVPVGDDDTTASQISHVVYRGHFSRRPKNVAIPMTCVHSLKHSRGNYVRSC